MVDTIVLRYNELRRFIDYNEIKNLIPEIGKG